MHSSVTEESIQKANGLFWEQMLAMRLEPIPHASHPGEDSARMRCIGPTHVRASCDLTGTWNGQIEVRLSRGLALAATSAMMMQPVDAIAASDLLDATREIANMIAGTLKSALPRPCALSVPSAEVEEGDFCVLPRTEDSVTVFFHHSSGELMVRVWEFAPAASLTAKIQEKMGFASGPLDALQVSLFGTPCTAL